MPLVYMTLDCSIFTETHVRGNRIAMRDNNMSTALVSAFYEVSDVLYRSYKNPPLPSALKPDKRAVGTPINGLNVVARRHSTSSAMSSTSAFPMGNDVNDVSGLRDRALSESERNQRSQTSRYKTELCRPFEENGTCKYGDKCQFAHGMHELRNLSRHPKYKSELCRTFHTVGFCPYGPRCHFVHNPEERKLGLAAEQARQQQQNRDHSGIIVDRPQWLHFNSMSAPLGSTGEDLTPVSDSPNSMTPPPSAYGEDVFFSTCPNDNLNDFSRMAFRPPSPPESLPDRESSTGESSGPVSPSSSMSSVMYTNGIPSSSAAHIYTKPGFTSSAYPMIPRDGRLPIFRCMSHEER